MRYLKFIIFIIVFAIASPSMTQHVFIPPVERQKIKRVVDEDDFDPVGTWDYTNATVIGMTLAGYAPSNATYITQTTNATLTNEFALSSLAAGLLRGNGLGGIAIPTIGLPLVDNVGTISLGGLSAYGAAGRVLKMNGAGNAVIWETDNNTTYVSDSPLNLIGTTFNIGGLSTFGMENQILKVQAGDATFGWGADNNTTYVSDSPLNLIGTTFNIGGLSTFGMENQILKVQAGDATFGWAADNNTTYTAGLPMNLVGTAFNIGGLSAWGVEDQVLKVAAGDATFGWAADNNTTYTAGLPMNLVGTAFNIGSLSAYGSQYQRMAMAAGGATLEWIWPNFLTASDGDPYQAVVVDADGDVSFGGNYAMSLQNIPDLVAGAGKTAYWFDGTDDYINVSDDANIDFGTGDFSLEIHFKPDNVTDANQFLMNKEAGGVGYGLEMQMDDLWIHIDDGAADATAIIGTAVFSANTWVRVIVTFNRDGDAIAYINGELTGTTVDISGSPLTLSSAGDLRIGTETGGATKPFGGEIDYVYEHNLVLTAAEAKALSNGASVPYKYTGASQTNLIPAASSTFATDGTSYWSTTGNRSTQAYDAVNLDMELTLTSTSTIRLIKVSLITIGKRYKISFSAYSADITDDPINDLSGYWGDIVFIDNPGNFTGLSQTYTFEATSISTSAEITNFVGQIGDVVSFDDIYITQIGCVAQYEPSGIDDGKWYDAGRNNLDGTVSGAIVVNPLTNIYIDNEEPSANEVLINVDKTVAGSRTDVFTVDEDGDMVVAGNVAGATYGSDGSVLNAELLYINTLSGNAQDQLDARCLESVFGTAIGTGLTLDATTLKTHPALQSIAGLAEVDVSILEATADNTYNVVTSGGNNYILGSNAGNTALEFKAPKDYGEMGNLSSAPATEVLATADQWQAMMHANIDIGLSSGFTYVDGTSGAISATSIVAGATVTMTSAGHSLAADDYITINGTTTYNRVEQVVSTDGNDFVIAQTNSEADEGGGNAAFQEGSYLLCATTGVYKAGWSGAFKQGVANAQTIIISAFINDTQCTKCVSYEYLENVNDFATVGGSALHSYTAGDRIWFAIQSTVAQTITFTVRNITIR